jgi:hypothetical protein
VPPHDPAQKDQHIHADSYCNSDNSGSIMYLVESEENGYQHSESIYWAIVTITTVGYGDMTSVTPMGKFIASVIMLIGYSIIAVPTGILTTEIALMSSVKRGQTCPGCGKEGHDDNAVSASTVAKLRFAADNRSWYRGVCDVVRMKFVKS